MFGINYRKKANEYLIIYEQKAKTHILTKIKVIDINLKDENDFGIYYEKHRFCPSCGSNQKVGSNCEYCRTYIEPYKKINKLDSESYEEKYILFERLTDNEQLFIQNFNKISLNVLDESLLFLTAELYKGARQGKTTISMYKLYELLSCIKEAKNELLLKSFISKDSLSLLIRLSKHFFIS